MSWDVPEKTRLRRKLESHGVQNLRSSFTPPEHCQARNGSATTAKHAELKRLIRFPGRGMDIESGIDKLKCSPEG